MVLGFDPFIVLHRWALFDVLSGEHTFCTDACAQPAKPAVPCAASAPADQQEQSDFVERLTLAPDSRSCFTELEAAGFATDFVAAPKKTRAKS